jgi:hypothetical protein
MAKKREAYIFAGTGASQLDASMKAALDKHPQLTKFLVCLPFDLPDVRPAKGKSARQKWESWKHKWEKYAAEGKRPLEILLWDRSALTGRLAKDKADYGGRTFYWFGKEALTGAWFVEQFEKARVALGSRYTPETNVELPIRRAFLALAT